MDVSACNGTVVKFHTNIIHVFSTFHRTIDPILHVKNRARTLRQVVEGDSARGLAFSTAESGRRSWTLLQHLLFSVRQLKMKELCLGLGRSQQGGPPGRERRASTCRARTRSRRDQPAQHRGVTHGLRVVYIYVIGVRERGIHDNYCNNSCLLLQALI